MPSMTEEHHSTAHGGTALDVFLVHPDSLDAHRCRISVARSGLLLRRIPDRPSGNEQEGSLLRVPWWAVCGFSADGTGTAPGGILLQEVAVVTDAGTLYLLASASDVSVLLDGVARWSARWSRSRRPVVAALARDAALWTAAIAGWRRRAVLTLRPLGIPLGRVRSGVSVVAWVLARIATVLAAILGPVGRLVARTTAPARRRLAVTVLGLAAAAAWRQGSALGGRLAVIVAGWDGSSRRLLRPVLAVSVSTLLVAGVFLSVIGGGSLAPAVAPAHGVNGRLAALVGGSGQGGSSSSSMLRMLRELQTSPTNDVPLNLPKATAPPAPAPPSLADEPPLLPHEVFGFAPYWTLTQSTGFDVSGLTTIAYFGIGVSPDGSLEESGSGWDGYESQELANLVTRAHAASVRVVLTVDCFDQGVLNQLTSSPTAPTTLSAALIQAIEAKNLDGVNIDFEGQGSADQVGLTNLITKVSAAIHAVNPNYQVTMDTYASSAGDPNGFYDIAALAPAVDAFFVMAYQLNLESTPTPASPLTSSMFSDLSTAEQYAAIGVAGKVILGIPYYGYSWPTTNGTMSAQATGPGTPVTYAQAVAGGHPIYWDSVTDTAWSSYQVGSQWYEDYFEDPSSLYLIAQMAQFFGLEGIGVWALGMDGNDPQMLAALDGFAPPVEAGPAGPAGPATTTTSGSAVTPRTSGSVTTTTSNASTTSSTLQAPAGDGPGAGAPSLRYSGVWQGQQVSLTPEQPSQLTTSGVPVYSGQLTGFQTNDPSLACLQPASGLDVWRFGSSTQYVVVAEQPSDCVTTDFTFPAPATAAAGSSGSGSGAGSGTAGTGTTTTVGGGTTTTTTGTGTTTTAGGGKGADIAPTGTTTTTTGGTTGGTTAGTAPNS